MAKALIEVCILYSIPQNYIEKSMSPLLNRAESDSSTITVTSKDSYSFESLIAAASLPSMQCDYKEIEEKGSQDKNYYLNRADNDTEEEKLSETQSSKESQSSNKTTNHTISSDSIPPPYSSSSSKENEYNFTKDEEPSSNFEERQTRWSRKKKIVVKKSNLKKKKIIKNNSMRTRRKCNKWSQDESDELRILCETGQTQGLTWAGIAEKLNEKFKGGKTGSMCHQHYKRVASSLISHDPWTKKEDESLLHYIPVYNAKWTLVANSLPGRTDTQCRRRWLQLKHSKKHKF